jgi:hypothetical protein
MAQQPVPVDTTATIGGSTLAYLFADRFVLTEQAGRSGMKAFGTGAVVQTRELSAGLVAIALWQLRERGALTLESYRHKRLRFISTSGVNVRVLQEVEARGVERRVLDHLLGSKRAREGRETAFDVANLVCRDGREPRGTIIKLAIDDAVELGYLQRVQGERGKGTRLEAVSDRVEALAPAAERLAVQWRDFRRGDEAEMAKLLRSTTFDGIETQARDSRNDD